MDTTYWTVGEVADLAHVTVRTLHHYDQIGLLVPSRRTGSGYRLYSEEDLERLHAILLYRELDLPLDAIRRVLDDPALERGEALRVQRERLVARRQRTDAIIQAVDRALESIERGTRMSTEEIFDGFDAFANAPEHVRAHQAEHGTEAQERWAGTDAWKESMRRARGFSKEDWTCSHEMHAGLADLYEADERFKAHYEERAEGLAGFVAAAIRANAEAAGADT